MAAEGKVTGQSQEQFLLLAKAARGAALASLIHQVLEAPGIYVFGELLDMPAVREVSPPRHALPCPALPAAGPEARRGLTRPLSRSWPTPSSLPSSTCSPSSPTAPTPTTWVRSGSGGRTLRRRAGSEVGFGHGAEEAHSNWCCCVHAAICVLHGELPKTSRQRRL